MRSLLRSETRQNLEISLTLAFQNVQGWSKDPQQVVTNYFAKVQT